MSKNHPELAKELHNSIGRLSKGVPDIMSGYSAMSAAAKKTGALDTKTKELIAIAISVANRCDGCIASHTNAAKKYGVKREEILEALGIAMYMGGGPSIVYAAQALDAFDQFVSAK